MGERLALPLLARLPTPSKRLRTENRLTMLAEPSGVQAEAFRMLRTNLEFASLGKTAKVVMITSAGEQEGKSTTIANLAVALARSGRHVVLVDLDLRRPYLNRFFQLTGPGITQVALGQVSLDDALETVAITEPSPGRPYTKPHANGNGNGAAKDVRGMLEVLPSGPIPPDPGEFVATHALTE